MKIGNVRLEKLTFPSTLRAYAVAGTALYGVAIRVTDPPYPSSSDVMVQIKSRTVMYIYLVLCIASSYYIFIVIDEFNMV